YMATFVSFDCSYDLTCLLHWCTDHHVVWMVSREIMIADVTSQSKHTSLKWGRRDEPTRVNMQNRSVVDVPKLVARIIGVERGNVHFRMTTVWPKFRHQSSLRPR